MPRKVPALVLPFLMLAALAGCHAEPVVAATKPCAWYFTSSRIPPGPVAWLAGVWTGHTRANAGEPLDFELVWTPLRGGTMLGMARTFPLSSHAADATLAVEFFVIRLNPDGKLVYLEQAGAAAPVAFEQVEAKDGLAVFERRDADQTTRVSFKLIDDGSGKLEMLREREGDRREWQMWREL